MSHAALQALTYCKYWKVLPIGKVIQPNWRFCGEFRRFKFSLRQWKMKKKVHKSASLLLLQNCKNSWWFTDVIDLSTAFAVTLLVHILVKNTFVQNKNTSGFIEFFCYVFIVVQKQINSVIIEFKIEFYTDRPAWYVIHNFICTSDLIKHSKHSIILFKSAESSFVKWSGPISVHRSCSCLSTFVVFVLPN